MSEKNTFGWKSIAVICIALLITLVTVMTASGEINLDQDIGVIATGGSNETEISMMYENLTFSVNDSAGSMAWLNLTFPPEFTLPLNTSLNYSGVSFDFIGFTGEDVIVMGADTVFINDTTADFIWADTDSIFFTFNISNITFSGSPGTYPIYVTTNWTSTPKTIWLTVDGAPTVTTHINPNVPSEWQQNGTPLYLNATINDAVSGVMNATVDVSSVNDTGTAILNYIDNFWFNNSLFVYAIDGIYDLEITTYDNASQVNNSVNFSIKVDNTAPVASVNTFEEALQTWVNDGTTLNLNATIADPRSGVLNATVLCTPINSTLTSVDLIYDGTSWINNTGAIVITYAQGRVNLTITTYDNASNMDDSVNFSVYVDNMEPGVNVLNYIEGQNVCVNNGTLLDLNVSVFESQTDESGINASAIFVDVSEVNGTQTAILEYVGVNGSNSDQTYWLNNSIIVDTATQGQVNLTVTVTDNATNVNDTVNFTMWVDNVAPSVTPHSVVYPVDMMFSIQQTAVKYDDVLTLNLTATDLGGSGIDVSDVSVNVTSINDSGDGWSDMYLSDGVWTTTVIVNNSDYTGTVYLDIEVYDNATNVNDTQSFEVELINTVPMFNGTLPITAMMWDGNETEIPTGLYFYYDDSFYDSPGDNPNDNITIQVNMTEHDLIVKANFSQVDGNDIWVEAVSNGNLYNITYQYGNFSDGTSSEQGRGVVIWAFNGAGYMNVSDGNETGFNGPLPFEAIVNVTPDDMYEDLLDGMATSDWSLDIDDFTNATELTFENMSSGKIVFTDSINLCDDTILDALQNFGNMMQFADAELSLNTSVGALGAMNKSANLTMYNLDYFTSISPGIMMDGVPVVMSGQTSGGTVMNVDWNSSGGFLSFTVDHWTSYSADGVGPSVTANSPTDLQLQWLTNGSILNLNASITDTDGSGMLNATVDVSSVNNTGVAELDFDGSFWTNNSLVVATSNQGSINLTITAYDNVSNVNNTVNMTVYVDVTAPVLTNLNASYPIEQDRAKRGDSVILNLTAEDMGGLSGLNTSSVQVDLSLINDTFGWTDFNPDGDNNWTYTVVINASTTDTINLPVRASDNATNINGTETISVELDNTPPNASTITYPSDGQVLQTNLTWVNGTTDADTYSVTIYVNGIVTNDTVIVVNDMYNVSNVPLGGESSDTEINVSSWDSLGNVNATNASITIGVDVANPEITMITPNASSPVYKQGGASLYVNFTYEEGSPKNYTVVISNATATINTSTSASVGASPINVEFNLNSTAAEGYYNVTVTMYDNSSRVNTSTVINAVVLDNTAPILPSGLTHTDDAPSGYDNDSSINLTWSAALDVYSANITYNVYQNGVLNTSTANITSCNISGVSDGTYIFNVSAVDGAGNVNTTNISTTIIVDTTAPIAPTIDVPTSMQVFSTSSIWVNGTTTNASNVTIYVNGTATNVSEIVSSNMFNVSNVPLGANDGTYVINVSAKDAAGNINATNASMTVILDTTDPVITITSPTTVSYNKAGASLYVNFTYTEANAKNYTVMIKNATTIINSTTTDATSSPVSVLFNLNYTAADGAYNVTVTMYDNASLTGNSTVDNKVVLDNTPPTAPSGLTPASGSYDDDGVSLSWTAASDDLSPTLNYSIYLNNVYNGSTISTSYSISGLTEGDHTFNVSAADVAGNVNATNDSTIITVDTIDPVISNLSLSTTSPSTYGASITVTVNVSDERSGMSAVSAAGVSLTHQSGDMWNGTISAGYGTNTVTVIATDNASNSVTNTSLSYTGPTAPSTDDDDGGRPNLPAPLPNVITTEGKGATLSEPAASVTLDFAKGEVMSIVVDAKDVMDSIYITVQKLEGKPADVAVSAPGNVHSYININVGRVSGEIAGADIAFKVEKKWLSQNNIGKDNVLLARFSEGVWQQLETTVLNGDDDFVHFSARTPGFSTFAIVAKEVAVTEPVDEVEVPVSVEEPASEVVDEVSAPVEEEGNGVPGFEAIFAVMGLLLVTLLVRKQEMN